MNDKEWSPIQTAPRDGTIIWLRFGQDHESPGWWMGGINFPWAFFDTQDGRSFLNHTTTAGPSHWRPYAHPTAGKNRRVESIRLLAHSIEALAANQEFDARAKYPGLTVWVDPKRDFMAEAESMYAAELDNLVMERCNERINKAALKCPPTGAAE